MPEHLDLAGVGHLTYDRIRDLYAVADDVRAPRRAARERIGLRERARLAVGRRLISLGTTLAGNHA